MKLFKKKKVVSQEEVQVQEFLDMISPSVIRFYSEYYICGNTLHSISIGSDSKFFNGHTNICQLHYHLRSMES